MSANGLRTFLTMLGMVIGVGAVILTLAVGQGAQPVSPPNMARIGGQAKNCPQLM